MFTKIPRRVVGVPKKSALCARVPGRALSSDLRTFAKLSVSISMMRALGKVVFRAWIAHRSPFFNSSAEGAEARLHQQLIGRDDVHENFARRNARRARDATNTCLPARLWPAQSPWIRNRRRTAGYQRQAQPAARRRRPATLDIENQFGLGRNGALPGLAIRQLIRDKQAPLATYLHAFKTTPQPEITRRRPCTNLRGSLRSTEESNLVPLRSQPV